MKKIFFLSLLFSLGFCSLILSQTKTLSIEDAYSSRKLYPKTLDQLQWIENSNDFSYVKFKTLIKGNVKDTLRDTILRLADLNAALGLTDNDVLFEFPQISWKDEKCFYFIENNNLYTYSLDAKKLTTTTTIHEQAENIDVSGKSLSVAYTINNNLWVSVNGKETAVTSDTVLGIVNGQSVHRDEFGISKGTFWSSNGSLLAFYRMDQSMVTDYPLVHISELKNRIAEEELIKYPMAGMNSHHVIVGVFDPKTSKTVFLKTGQPAEQYLTNITWSPDEKYIYIEVLNRAQNHMWLNQYDVATGNFVKTLFEKENEKYVEPLHPIVFLNNNKDEFIFQSPEDGYNHLYLYNTSGKLIKQITRGNWGVTDFLGLSADDSKAFYLSTQNSPLDRMLYVVNLKSGKIICVNETTGVHDALVSSDGNFVIDHTSSNKLASSYDLFTSAGKFLQNLFKHTNPLQEYKLPETSIFTIKAKDGCDLYCRLIKPVDFDPLKKYPVIVYVYGGPHEQLIDNSWLNGSGLYLNYLTEKGYIVFTLDNHGTAFRGQTFEQAVFRNLGTIEAEDQMLGVDYLKKLPYVDTAKLGVYGWSYGGFMTISMMLKNPGVFKVAVAGGPVIDWKYYEVMYGERYMDTPEENPLGYDNANLLNYIDSLQGKLLVIHGTIDPTVVWQHSLSFIKKCIEKGKQVDYFVYPEQEHNMRGKSRMHLLHKIEDYFNDFLK